MPSEAEQERCVIWSKTFTTENPKVKVGEKGMDTLIKFCGIRQRLNLRNMLHDVMEKTDINKEKKVSVLVHSSCRKDFQEGNQMLY